MTVLFYDFKLLLRNLKYALPVLTIISLCKMALFYSLFNIKIGSYITIEEILTPFIGDLLFYSMLVFLPYIILVVFGWESLGHYNTLKFKNQSKLSFLQRLNADLKENWFMILFLVCNLVAFLFFFPGKDIILPFLAGWPLMMFLFWLRRELLIRHNFKFTDETITFYNLSTVMITVVLLMIITTYSDANHIKNSRTQTAVIEFDGTSIVCKGSLRFVGRTKSFTFIYNSTLQQTTILDNGLIKKVIFCK